jgi:hypothetical protein
MMNDKSKAQGELEIQIRDSYSVDSGGVNDVGSSR